MVVFPAGFTVGSCRAGDIPAPTDGAGRRRSTFQTGQARDAADLLRLPRRRPAGLRYVETQGRPRPSAARRSSSRSGRGPTTRPGPIASASLVARALPVLSQARSGCPGRDHAGLIVHEAVSRDRPAATPACSTRRPGTIEVAYYADDFVVLHESAHAWFNGSLLADRWADEAFASYYGARGRARRSRSRRPARRSTPSSRPRPHPAQRLGRRSGASRPRPRTTPTPPRSTLARAIADRAGPTALRGLGRCGRRIGAYQPPAGAACGGLPAGGRTGAARDRSTGRPTGAACSTCSRARRAARYDDLWRTLGRARHRPAAARRPRGGPDASYDAVATAAAAGWQLPRPVRDAMRAWQFDAGDGLPGRARGDPRPARPRSQSGAAAAGLTAADDPAQRPSRPRAPRASARREAPRARGDRRDHDAAAARSPAVALDRSRQVGLSGTSPEADLARPARAFASRRPRPAPRPPPRRPMRPGAGAEDIGASVRLVERRGPRGGRRCSGFVLIRAPGSWPRRAARRPVAGSVVAHGDRALRPARPTPVHSADQPVGSARRDPTRDRARETSGLMGLTRTRPSHEILSGDSADVYFARAESILAREGLDPARDDGGLRPPGRPSCAASTRRKNLLGHVLAERRPGRDRGSRRSTTATRIEPKEIVLRIRARYRRFGLYETAFLGMLAQSTGWATAARDVRRRRRARAGHQLRGAARPPGHHRRPRLRGDRRRLRRRLDAGRRPAGRPRPDRHDAALAGPDLRRHGRGGRSRSTAHVAPDVPRIVLVDTFKDEAEEALRVAHALGDRLYGVRLDTPSERGRVTADLVQEVRARLDQAGFEHVKIVGLGRPDPRADRLLQGSRAPGRLVRRRLVHQRRHADRLHRRHQGDRRPADRQARPDPGLTDSPRLSRSTSPPTARA